MSTDATQIPQPRPPQPPAPAPDNTGRMPRVWFAIVLIALLLLAPVVPSVTTWGGIILGVIVALMIVPQLRQPLRAFLRVSPGHPIHGTFKLVALFLYAGLLITAGRIGAEHRDRVLIEARQPAAAPDPGEP